MSIESNLQELDSIRKDAQSILQHLSDTQVNQSPGEGRWSVGQCFSHLIVTGRVELPFIEEAIRKGRKRQIVGSEPFRYGLFESWFVQKMDVQSGMKFKAPKVYAPTTEQFTAPKLLSDFLSLQDQWESCFKDAAGLHLRKIRVPTQDADGLHLGKIRVPTSVTRWITFSLGKNFELFLAHERRHLQQARLTLLRR